MSLGDIKRTYEWEYNGYKFKSTFKFPKKIYEVFKYVWPHSLCSLDQYVNERTNRSIVSKIAETISKEAARLNLDNFHRISAVISFVQSLPYTSDYKTTGHEEYVRYPIETLVDCGGDCEDTAILMAALLSELNIGCVLLSYDTHVAVGVLGEDTRCGSYFEYAGRKYFYLETTAKGWEIGQIPDEYKTKPAGIIVV